MNLLDFREVCPVGRGVHATDSAGEWLRGVGFARPSENLGQERDHASGLFFQLLFRVAASVVSTWLVPKVPGEDAVVFGKRSDDALDVGSQARNLCGVRQRRGAGTLHPTGVVHAGNRRMLRAKMRQRVPARVEEYKHWTDVVARGNGEEAVDALLKAGSVLLPEKIVEKDAHSVHAQRFGPG